MSLITSNDHDYVQTLHNVTDAIKNAEYVLVGGAAGISASNGPNPYDKNDPIYLANFKVFEDKYHAGSIWNNYYLKEYTGRNWESRENHWGFKITLMHFNLHEPIYQPYIDLKEILKDKDFDIVTTNQDTQFARAFPEKNVAIIQGDWRYFQCTKPCHDKVYDFTEKCEELFPKIVDGNLPTDLIPRCPKCGAEMHEWVRGFNFLEGSFYEEQYDKYKSFIEKARKKKTVYFELGVGRMTPMFIKDPFIDFTRSNPNSTYIPVNPKDAIVPKIIEKRSIPVRYDIGRVFSDLKKII